MTTSPSLISQILSLAESSFARSALDSTQKETEANKDERRPCCVRYGIGKWTLGNCSFPEMPSRITRNFEHFFFFKFEKKKEIVMSSILHGGIFKISTCCDPPGRCGSTKPQHEQNPPMDSEAQKRQRIFWQSKVVESLHEDEQDPQYQKWISQMELLDYENATRTTKVKFHFLTFQKVDTPISATGCDFLCQFQESTKHSHALSTLDTVAA